MVNGVQRLIDFLEAIPGPTLMRRCDRSARPVMHTGVDIGDSVIIIADADPNHRVLPVRRLAYVPNVDEVCGRAWTVSREVMEEPKAETRRTTAAGLRGTRLRIRGLWQQDGRHLRHHERRQAEVGPVRLAATLRT